MTQATENTQALQALPPVQGVPIGTILAYGGDISQSSILVSLSNAGWLFCNGDPYSTSDYPDLYNVIGFYFGGNLSTIFNVPNLQGQFLRGVSNGTGTDPDANSRTTSGTNGSTGDKVGSYQVDAFASHNHVLPYNNSPQSKGDNGGRLGFIGDPKQNSEDTGGSETRPKNIYVNFIIKAKNV